MQHRGKIRFFRFPFVDVKVACGRPVFNRPQPIQDPTFQEHSFRQHRFTTTRVTRKGHIPNLLSFASSHRSLLQPAKDYSLVLTILKPTAYSPGR
jgi:hypothetical protein